MYRFPVEELPMRTPESIVTEAPLADPLNIMLHVHVRVPCLAEVAAEVVHPLEITPGPKLERVTC